MPAPGFPSQNPRRNKPNTVRSPVTGSLMEWMQWNFPDVYAQVKKVRRHPIRDYKSKDYAKQHPSATGRTP
jgi:hypothetical protein